jgi:hypothetical protein
MTTPLGASAPTLDLEAVAALDALIRRDGADAGARALVSRRTSVEAYQEAKLLWKARIQAAQAQGDGSLVVAYAAAYRKALADKHAPHPAPDEPAALPTPTPTGTPPPRPIEPELPTYLAAQPRTPSTPAPSPSEPPAPGPAAPRARPVDPLDSTLEVQRPTAKLRTTLPFRRGASPLAKSDAPPQPRSAGFHGTVAMDPGQSALTPALPFAGGEPDLTLNQYASLCAELGAGARERAEILQSYRLRDEPALERLHRVWTKKIEGEPGLREQLAELSNKYAAWLAQR